MRAKRKMMVINTTIVIAKTVKLTRLTVLASISFLAAARVTTLAFVFRAAASIETWRTCTC